ncbi:MAG: hypothetical protein AAF531_18730 [Actinomycetota bacterium]
MLTRHVRVALCIGLAAVTLFVVGCSSSGDDDVLAPLDTTADVEETSTSTTEPTTTTSETTTTTEPTTTTEDTVRPELDPDNWTSDLDEIFGRYLLYWQALDEAYARPEADPDNKDLADLVGAEALVDVRADIDQGYLQGGLVLVIADDSLEEHVLRLPRPTSLTKTEGNEVIIQDCWIADRTKETLDGEIIETWSFPTVFNVTMQVIDSEWRVFASVTAEDGSDGWDECNAYFANLDS